MAQQVLHLPELLENILLRLPIKDLLFSQKVCGTWKAVVDTSPHIQEALFYTNKGTSDSDVTSQPCSCHSHPCSCHIKNPLLSTSAGTVGFEDGLKNLLTSKSPNAEESCNRMLLTKPERDAQLHIQVSGGVITKRTRDMQLHIQVSGRGITPPKVLELHLKKTLGTMVAVFPVGPTLVESRRQYGKVMDELRRSGWNFELRRSGSTFDRGFALSIVGFETDGEAERQ
ncbi:hypothetical protein LTR17_019057 [Elasticomyces elasticus]|nr:hypothetical protein LTR17_019057 [Elasticomyces elasticus]